MHLALLFDWLQGSVSSTISLAPAIWRLCWLDVKWSLNAIMSTSFPLPIPYPSRPSLPPVLFPPPRPPLPVVPYLCCPGQGSRAEEGREGCVTTTLVSSEIVREGC